MSEGPGDRFDVEGVGPRVRALRVDRGLSLSALADQAGVSKGYLSTIERGGGTRPGVAVLHRVASALDVTLGDLLRETGSDE